MMLASRTTKRILCDPTTSNVLYTEDEVQFMQAMDQYKREAHSPKPDWDEVLRVAYSLGYRRVVEPIEPLPFVRKPQ